MVVTSNVAAFEDVVRVSDTGYRPGAEYVAVTFSSGSPVSFEATTVCLFPFPKFHRYCVMVQLEFEGASKNPPAGCTTSPALKTGAVGLLAAGKLMVGTDAFCA
jgi:hypothetical protein